MVVLGVIALVVVIAGMVIAIRLAGAQERETAPPPSEPGDFVAKALRRLRVARRG